MDTFRRMLALSVVMVAFGCDPADSDADGLDAAAIKLRPGGGGSGGVYLNTSAIGSHAFSELDLKGGKHDGVILNKVTVRLGNGNPLQLDSVFATDGELRGLRGSTTYTGPQLVSSQWDLTIFDGATQVPATMWISAATQTGGAWRYTFQHIDGSGQPAYLCAPDLDGSSASVPLKDLTVDPVTGDMATRKNTLYLACTSGAVGKAVAWGYHPWELPVAEFEAMVRVVRADYCGDGVSWTVPGTALQLTDVWDINQFADASAQTEAVWGPNGARCVGQRRASGDPVSCGGVTLPVCAASASLDSYSDALAWTKLVP